MTTKTPERLAIEYADLWPDMCINGARKGFLAGYQAAINSPEKQDSWISVKDRLPEYDQLVLIWHPGFKRPYVGSRVDSALMSPLYWWRCELDMYEPEEVITHWKPLSTPPEEA